MKTFFSKDDPAIHEHHYPTTKKQYNEETHNIYNTDNTITYNIKNNGYTGEHYHNKQQTSNNNITNSVSKQHYLVMNMYFLFKDYSSNNYVSNNCNYQVAYVELNLYKRSDSRTSNNTHNISNNLNQYITDVVNNGEINKVSNLKETYCNFIDGVGINKQ